MGERRQHRFRTDSGNFDINSKDVCSRCVVDGFITNVKELEKKEKLKNTRMNHTISEKRQGTKATSSRN